MVFGVIFLFCGGGGEGGAPRERRSEEKTISPPTPTPLLFSHLAAHGRHALAEPAQEQRDHDRERGRLDGLDERRRRELVHAVGDLGRAGNARHERRDELLDVHVVDGVAHRRERGHRGVLDLL